jgi:hypothetical protein
MTGAATKTSSATEEARAVRPSCVPPVAVAMAVTCSTLGASVVCALPAAVVTLTRST